jgi:alpha-beta hydrolase superfamily lysophospholipase
MSKPSILLITGSFALPEFYSNIVSAITSKGYEIRALHSPTVSRQDGPRGDPPSMYDDAAFIAKETEKLADEGKDVILLPHSYGGVPTTQSTKGLSKDEREKQGKKGGIVRIAYMTCIVPAVGVPAAGVLADVPEENRVELKIDVRCFPPPNPSHTNNKQEQGWMYQDPISRTAEIAFSDLPKAEGEAWALKFGRHSALSFTNELTYAGYKDIPVSYLLCEDDLCIPPKTQREGVEVVEKVSGRTVDVTSIRAGHCPSASQPEKVIEWILKVAGAV